MTIVKIPTQLLEASGLKSEEVKNELAIELFRQGRITTSQLRAVMGEDFHLVKAFEKLNQSEQIDLDAFMSWAAHDFKSPLNTMIGFTKVVLKGIDGPVNEMQAADLTTAHGSAQRMLELINNLIDMARLNRNELQIEIIPGDLFQTVVDAATRWKTLNPARELQTDIGFNVPIFSFDPGRLRQALTGLLTYSANHVAEGGKVSLSVREEERRLLFEISSQGEKALDKYDMDLAMQSFICSGLIRLHGGSLTIGKDTGYGLALTFSLPLD